MSYRYETRVGVVQSDVTTHFLLSRMCLGATRVFNSALWYSRQQWEQVGKIPTGYDLEKVVKDLYWHKQIPASVSCYTAQEVGRSYKSWFALKKKDPKAMPPMFRRKDCLSPMTYRPGTYSITSVDPLHSKIDLALGQKFKSDIGYPYKRLSADIRWNSPLPEGDYTIALLEVVPSDRDVSQNDHFEIHIKVKLEERWREEGQVMFIDLGVVNPIVSMTEAGRVDIFKGGSILSNIRYWNRVLSHLSERVMKESNKKYSKKIKWAYKKRNAQINQKLHSLVNTFVEVCKDENVKEVVVGDFKGMKKQASETWRRNPSEKDKSRMKTEDSPGSSKEMQKVMQFPVQRMVSILEYKLAREGIRLVTQDESGTSTGRCFVCGHRYTTDKARVKRGLFKCEHCRNLVNADINGVGNQRARYLGLESTNGVLDEGLSVWESNVWRWCDENRWKLAHVARGHVTFKTPVGSRHINFPNNQQGISVKGNNP